MGNIAIIGSNFGDEGKGQLVDYFASLGKHNIVVRANGGPQAGHTVVLNDKRFVFSQFGSGSLAGLPCHLSRFVLVNPIFAVREMQSFFELTGKNIRVSCDPSCEIITPLDVTAGRINAERTQHGSVGHGIHATTKRAAIVSFSMVDIMYRTNTELLAKIKEIEDYYEAKMSDQEIADFLIACRKFINNTLICEDYTLQKEDIIFENAQGLGLDRNSGYFPYVTDSNTGLQNISLFLGPQGSVRPVYVTRTFLTRHGNGPLTTEVQLEVDDIPNARDDITNSWNEWQGSIRFGELDVKCLINRVKKDMHEARLMQCARILHPSIAITWGHAFPEKVKELNEAFDWSNTFVFKENNRNVSLIL